MNREEAAFHDALAERVDAHALPRTPPDHLEQAMLESLGSVTGLRVLELGCGKGDVTMQLLERHADVTAIDISEKMVEIARERARLWFPSSAARFMATPAEKTTLDSSTFDVVLGKWLLHHVDVAAVAAEIDRVLRPGGVGIFIENSGRNRLLAFARRNLAGRLGIPRYGTLDEHPLVASDFSLLGRRFRRLELLYPDFFFFRLFDRQVFRGRWRWPSRLARALDNGTWAVCPPLRRYSFHVIVRLEK